MTLKSRLIPFILLTLILLISALFVYRSHKSKEPYISNTTTVAGSDNSSAGNKQETSEQPKNSSYTSPDGYTISLLPGLQTSNFEDGDANVVMVQLDTNLKSDRTYAAYSNFQMQISTRPFDEDVDLTFERILKDVPDLKMQTPTYVNLDGVTAVSFIDAQDQTRQLWLVKNRQLYQIIAKAEFDNVTGTIMQGWKWE